MKILLRPRLYSQALAGRLAADPLLAQTLGAEANAAVGFLFKKFFDAQGPAFAQVLAHARAIGERPFFLRDMQFTTAEIAAAEHLEVVCRKTIAQSPAESRATLADYHGAALQATTDGWAVRLPERAFLGRPVPPDTIAHVDQYTGEYVLGSTAAEALRASGLEGWELRPVLHWKTQAPLADMGMHLTTRTLLPGALPTAGRQGRSDPPWRPGALAYAAAALDASGDFARTAEPWGPWATPKWIVRQQVRAWVERHRLRGWAFWPVLEAGTALHDRHEAQWSDLLARVRDAGGEVA